MRSRKVTEAEPGYADGWLNVARALIQEGETDAAKPFIEKSLKSIPKLGRTWYFKALIEKADGDYDDALQVAAGPLRMYPRDRVVLNQIARILFLQRQYAEAIKLLDSSLRRRSGRSADALYADALLIAAWATRRNARAKQKLFQRFKAEESVAVHHRQRATAESRKTTTSGNRSTITKVCLLYRSCASRDHLRLKQCASEGRPEDSRTPQRS